jgi:hypothetical protein
MTPLELKPARGKLLLLLLASIAFVALGLWFVTSAPSIAETTHRPAWFIQAIGVLSILFFGICGFQIVRQLFDTRPRLILDDRGIFDRTLSTPVIPWSTILDAQIVQVKRSKFIALRLTDEEQRFAALPSAKRMMGAANQGLGFGRFNLNLAALSLSAEELLAIIHRERALRGPFNPTTP